jgi:predicted PurR-regulated permease PerM
MSLDRKTMRKIIWLIVLAGLVLVISLNILSVISGISWVLGILYPFFLGGCMAFVLNIPMSFFERTIFENGRTKDSPVAKKVKRPLSLILSALIILAVIALVSFYFIPKLTTALTTLTDAANNTLPKWSAWLNEKFAKYPTILEWIQKNELQSIDVGKIFDEVSNLFVSGANTGFSRLMKLATTVINKAVNIGIGIAVACYLCAGKEKHKERFLKFLYGIFPEKGVKRFLSGCAIANDTFHKFITGQCFEALILGVLVGMVLWVMQMPYAFVIAIICSICCFIPIFGAIIAGVAGGIIVLTAKPAMLLAFVIIFVAIRIFDDNYMYPHIIGKSIGMPAVFVLFAITVGGALFGFGGMLFFIPLTSFIYKLIKKGISHRLKTKELRVSRQGKLLHGLPEAGAAGAEDTPDSRDDEDEEDDDDFDDDGSSEDSVSSDREGQDEAREGEGKDKTDGKQ